MESEYRCLRVETADALERERLLAEAFDAGAGGAEELDGEGGRCRADIYVPSECAQAVWDALRTAASPGARIGRPEALAPVDWSQAWREGLEAQRISARLVVRPPFVSSVLDPGQGEIVIDPGQAFGTGAHASTRLCLEWIDALVAEGTDLPSPVHVLDVGTGSGVLALAALRLGATGALGFDLDPVAIEAARQAAIENRLDDRARFVTGPIEAVADRPEGWSLVLANLLKREMGPIAGAIARRVAAGGRLVLAGLLEEDRAEVLGRFAAEGLCESAPQRIVEDDVGRWIGLCLGREVGRPT